MESMRDSFTKDHCCIVIIDIMDNGSISFVHFLRKLEVNKDLIILITYAKTS